MTREVDCNEKLLLHNISPEQITCPSIVIFYSSVYVYEKILNL